MANELNRGISAESLSNCNLNPLFSDFCSPNLDVILIF